MFERMKKKLNEWMKKKLSEGAEIDIPGYLSPILRIILVLAVSVGQELLHGLPQTRHAVLVVKVFYTRHPNSAALMFSIVATLIGFSASRWKKHSIKTYAAGEIAFGCSVVFSVLRTLVPQFDFSKLFAVGSAIYVISRGFNNLSEGEKAAAVDTPDKALAKAQ